MKKLTTMVLLSTLSVLTFGQTTSDYRKSLYFEIAGSGGIGSMNFEKSFVSRNHYELTWSAGLSLAPIDKNNGTVIVFPLMIHSLIGKSNHKLELGLGQGITVTTKGSAFALATAAVGYRYLTKKERWYYRLSYTPLISYLVDFQVQNWAGISIGYNLNQIAK